ncbi:MAG: hypothetical protein WC969_12065 [Elusimicrobiota bacterium]|jgi:S1-C subfamily serine protease
MRKLLLAVSCSVLAACSGAPVRVEAPYAPGGRLGVRTADAAGPELRKDLGVPEDLPGQLVLAVMSGSPAADCAIEAGDFLALIDGAPFAELSQLKAKGAGAKVVFEARREGSSRTLSCTLGGFPAALGLMATPGAGGLKLEGAPKDSALEAAMRSMRWPPNPVFIETLDGRKVASIDEVKAALAGRRPGETVLVGLRSYYSKKKPQVPITLKDGEGLETPPLDKPAARAPKTLVVAQDGSGDFRTPLGALLRSVPGDTLLLRAGRYAEPLEVRMPERTLRGEGEKTVLTGGLFIRDARGTVVEDLTVERAIAAPKTVPSAADRTGGRSSRIAAQRRAPTAGNPSLETVGLIVRGADGTVLRRVQATGGQPGIAVEASREVVLEDCRARLAGIGFLLHDGAEAKVLRAVSHENNDGLVVAGDSTAGLRALTLADNRARGLVVEAGRAELYDSILAGSPTLLLCQDGCRLSGGYNDYFEGNLCSGGGRGALSCAAASEGGKDVGLKKESDLSVDPLFAERLKGDYRLSLESPLIGRGRGGGHIGALAPVGSGAGGEGFR